MSIGVQTTNAALLALQTLGQLNNPASADDATASTAAAAVPTSSSVIADSAVSASSLGLASASLDRASSIADAALSAGQSVADLLDQLKSLAGEVQDGSVAGGAANSDYSSLLGQIGAAVSGAGFDGVNLLDGSASPAITLGAGTSGQVTLAAPNLSLGGGVITLGAASTLSTAASAADVLSNVDASLANLAQALGQISDQSSQISAHANFVARLSAVLSTGGDAASAPTSADGARLMALQLQQQLSLGGNIASTAPNVVLSLFQ
jgi:flagellin